MKYKTLQIKDSTHKIIKNYCNDHFLKMNEFVAHVLLKYIEDERKIKES